MLSLGLFPDGEREERDYERETQRNAG